MIIELNIGLNIAGSANLQSMCNSRADYALEGLRSNAYLQNVLGSRRAQSATEDTLIVKLNVSGGSMVAIRKAINELAADLCQDCIAMYVGAEWRGELIGPNAAAWGEFNPEYFLRFDPKYGPSKVLKRTTQNADQLDATRAVRYTGHGANTGGLQGHSVGSDYPYMIIGVQDRLEAPTEWQVMDSRTGNKTPRFPTYQRAQIELTSLKIRNCMHS